MTEIEKIIPRLKYELIETLNREYGRNVLSVDVEKIINRGFSSVAFIKVTTSVNECRMVAKKTVHHAANISITSRQNQAIVEFETLSTLFPKYLSVPYCSVPKPILVIPEEELFVMEFVEGKLLVEEFVKAKYSYPQKSFLTLEQNYHQCGMWLKHLHQFTGIHKAGIELINNTLERIEQKLLVIEHVSDKRCPRNLTDNIRKLIESQMGLIQDDNIFITGRHGDFGNWNIIVDSEGVTVFDFLGYQLDLLPIDLLKMLMNLEDEKSYLLYSSKRIEELKNAFLNGYGVLPIVNKPILVICETLHRVCCLCARVENQSKNIFRKFEQEISFNRNLNWLMNDDRKSLWPV